LFADIALRPEAQKVVEQYANGNGNGAKAVFQKTDVRVWKELERMFEVAERELGGGVDVVCPGAGVYDPHCEYIQFTIAGSRLIDSY
jgi:NAD(P)-dependent dehydrogenase (short-subunit alcohol dehydrogenase family)